MNAPLSQRLSQPRYRISRQSLICVTLLVISTLLVHSLDACAAHLGTPSLRAASLQTAAACLDKSAACAVCTAHDESHSDVCELLSETAVLTLSSPWQAEYGVVAPTIEPATIPPIPSPILLSGCLFGRAGPPTDKLVSSCLSSSLSSRAPPFSA